MSLDFSRAHLMILGPVPPETMRHLLYFYFAASVNQCSMFSKGVAMEANTFPGETGSWSPLTLILPSVFRNFRYFNKICR